MVREHGGLVIADEVQSGLGRAGSNMWAFMDHGLTPDIVTLGKVGVYIDIYNIYTIYILSTLPAGRGCRPRHRSRSAPAVPRPPGGSASLCPDTEAPT